MGDRSKTPTSTSETNPNAKAKSIPIQNTAFADPEVQTVLDGKGPLFHRKYHIDLECKLSPAEVISALKDDINSFSPQLLARFEKTKGDLSTTQMKPGDEFQIYISGPWNGPVRVLETTPTSFTLITLEGHLEAGEIHFRAYSLPNGQVRFEIESVARSADSLVNLLYDKLPVVRFAQTQMWVSFCKEVARRSGDTKEADVKIMTERADQESGDWKRV